ncbi:MAG TPA: double zinc ribbon domain-containing protein [Solirubrobacterales bacterium]|nr:double zinc ribbon domain-containing protein [Solirubrobacterales bacterium]
MRTAVALLGSLIAPPRCAICDAATEARHPLCARCEAELSSAAPQSGSVPGVESTWSAAPYGDAARGLVAALKFRRLLPLARRAATAIHASVPPGLLDGALVPVPAAPLRLRARGFDPAEQIALELARLSGRPLAPCLRRSQGPRQVGRPRAERLASPPRVVVRGEAPARSILVDDVLTTGSTLAACGAALREAGGERVVAVTFARSGGKELGVRPSRA